MYIKKMKLHILCLSIIIGFSYAEKGPFEGERQTVFDWSLVYKALVNEKSNAIISPVSIKFLLTLLYEAAGQGTDTEKQLRIIFANQQPDIVQQRKYFEQIIKSGKSESKDYVFKFGTKIYAHENLKILQKYNSITCDNYDTDIENVDFNDVKKAVETINKWTSDATGGNIKNLVDEETVKHAIILMLNAIYFKGVWTKPFIETTSTNKFHTADGKVVETQFMMQRNDFYIAENDKINAQILRLPYAGNKFAMYLVLPNENSNLKQLLNSINENQSLLNAALSGLKKEKIEVSIPIFKFDFTANLNSAVKSLGVREIFTDSASLPLLSRGQGTGGEVKITNILQKAGISVDQKGSEAYAASEFELVNKFDSIPNQNFYANRPFLFFVEDETNGGVLLAGKLENPYK